MKLTDAKIDRYGRLQILVDRRPAVTDLIYTAHPYDGRRGVGGGYSGTIYLAVEQDSGYVHFLVDTGDGQGCNGRTFKLRLSDGSVRQVVGPWSGSADDVNALAGDVTVYTGRDVCLHDTGDAALFDADQGGWIAHLTQEAADQALRLASARHSTEAVLPGRSPAIRLFCNTGPVDHSGEIAVIGGYRGISDRDAELARLQQLAAGPGSPWRFEPTHADRHDGDLWADADRARTATRLLDLLDLFLDTTGEARGWYHTDQDGRWVDWQPHRCASDPQRGYLGPCLLTGADPECRCPSEATGEAVHGA